MKKIFLLVVLLASFLFQNAHGQGLYLGINGIYGSSVYDSNNGFGIGLNLEYSLPTFPFTIKIEADHFSSKRTRYPDLNHDYNTTSVDLETLYFLPLKLGIPLYIGLGVGINKVQIFLPTKSVFYFDIYATEIKKARNSVGYKFIIGSNLSISSKMMLVFELNYKIMSVRYDLELQDEHLNKQLLDKWIRLDNILFNFGIAMKL